MSEPAAEPKPETTYQACKTTRKRCHEDCVGGKEGGKRFCENHLCPLCDGEKSCLVETCHTCNPERAFRRLVHEMRKVPPPKRSAAPPLPSGPPPSVPAAGPPLPTSAPPPALVHYSFTKALPDVTIDDVPTPKLIVDCCDWLHRRGLKEEGLFRIPGNLTDVLKIKADFFAGVPVDVEKISDPHTVTGIIKHYFRELDPPFLPSDLVPYFEEAGRLQDPSQRVSALRQLVKLFPEGQLNTLRVTARLCKAVVDNEKDTMMSLRNMATCIGPSMLGAIENLNLSQMIVATWISNPVAVLGSEAHPLSPRGSPRSPRAAPGSPRGMPTTAPPPIPARAKGPRPTPGPKPAKPGAPPPKPAGAAPSKPSKPAPTVPDRPAPAKPDGPPPPVPTGHKEPAGDSDGASKAKEATVAEAKAAEAKAAEAKAEEAKATEGTGDLPVLSETYVGGLDDKGLADLRGLLAKKIDEVLKRRVARRPTSVLVKGEIEKREVSKSKAKKLDKEAAKKREKIKQDSERYAFKVMELVQKGNIEKASFYFECGLDVNCMIEGDGWRPVHMACFAGQVDILRMLVLRGANLRVLSKAGELPLHLAVKGKHVECVRFLVEEAKVDARELLPDGRTPLAVAEANKDEESAAILFAASKVFGMALPKILDQDRSGRVVPLVVEVLMRELMQRDCRNLALEGVFRLSGAASEVEGLKRLHDTHPDPGSVPLDTITTDEFVPAAVLKMFVRELAEPPIPVALYDAFLEIGRSGDDSLARLSPLQGLIARVPRDSAALLECLVLFLALASTFAKTSKMVPDNLAIVFAPNILRKPNLSPLDEMADSKGVNSVFSTMIELCLHLSW